VERDIVLMS